MIIKSNTFAASLEWTRKLRFFLFRSADLIFERLGRVGFFNTTYSFFTHLKRNEVSFEDGGEYFKLALEGTRYLVRKYTSDEQVFIDVVIDGEYEVGVDLAKRYIKPVLRIVDAGANCGITSVRFASQFPGSTVIAVEPDMSNFKALIESVSYSCFEDSIKPVNAALSAADCMLSEGVGLDDRHWGKVFRRDGKPGNTKGMSLRSLLAEFRWNYVDILKIDIEGAEFDLFSDLDFQLILNDVKLIVVEIHDLDTRKMQIQDLLSKMEFFVFEHVHLTIAIQKKIIS